MKIREKVSLTFAVLTALVLVISNLIIYYFSAQYRSSEFFDRLKDKTFVNAQKQLERDEMDPENYSEISRRYVQELPEELEYYYRLDSVGTMNDARTRAAFPASFLQEINTKGYAEYTNGEHQSVGITYSDNEGNFVFVTTAVDVSGFRKLLNLRYTLVSISGIALLVVYLLGGVFAVQLINPIANIIQGVNRITVTNLHLRLKKPESRDELYDLSETFNGMLDRLETTFVMQKNFISNASHELKNPLAAIIGETDIVLSKDRTPEEYRNSLMKISGEAERLNQLLTQLLNLSRAEFDELISKQGPVPLDDVIWAIHKELSTQYPGAEIKVRIDLSDDTNQRPLVSGNPQLLTLGIRNLIDNAVKFSSGRPIQVDLKTSLEGVQLTIVDQGIGIPAIDLQNIFQPLYRASNARAFKGYGIGLSLADRIIRLHGGILKIESNVENGTTAHILFPA
jgi:signal transduction histidine kinase